MKYRKKPVVIEAVQWTGENENEIASFCPDCYWDGEKPVSKENGVLIVKTLEGQHVASFSDFIIKGVQGEFYPCKPDIFAKTYEQADTPDLLALLKRCKPWLDVMRKEYSMRTTLEIAELGALLFDIAKAEEGR